MSAASGESYVFFLSYARADAADGFLDTFFEDLRKTVRVLTGIPRGAVAGRVGGGAVLLPVVRQPVLADVLLPRGVRQGAGAVPGPACRPGLRRPSAPGHPGPLDSSAQAVRGAAAADPATPVQP